MEVTSRWLDIQKGNRFIYRSWFYYIILFQKANYYIFKFNISVAQ